MPQFSFHASQEQFPPEQLLALAQQAEAAGFDAVFSSDHAQPWSPSQGHSALSWVWLGAALQATRRLRFGTITVPGGWRYQPLVLAQGIATLQRLYPGRLPWVALGSGEAVNEGLVGQGWPDKPERNQRLQRAAQAMRRLLDGERVTEPGPPAVVDARLWCRPPQRTVLVGAATSVETARWLGGWAEGLLTVSHDLQQLRALIAAFREQAGPDKPVHVKVDLSWADTDAQALEQAFEQWRFNAGGSQANADARQPEDFVRLTAHLRPEDMRAKVMVAADLGRHVDHLRQVAALGVTSIDLHQVGGDQAAFIEAFGREVLPALRA
ncbi:MULTISPECIES: TIGR03885 family FMN-dependent LLM class oxidoreductase [Aquincola]|uniref:TIGR03885 family FMN-dependent LLM class oxidoreductase n=1 Tax=Aquincola TaxID=391952 RepID=UPI00061513C3|nr:MULTISPECIES: TIGR03885 family FMN-dependent LLM class oxidoreductase [Aquincola]MCR5864186.1 TIGR03885 family FMN-dependent LLM class oxidoreductase [Aquincola sp. J276]